MAKTRRRLLKQFAILIASTKIAFYPEILNFAHNPFSATLNKY